jgi:hypothetical protein
MPHHSATENTPARGISPPVFFPLLFAARRPKILEIKPRASAFVDGSQWIRSLGVITRPDESQILHSPGLTFRITLIFSQGICLPKKAAWFLALERKHVG